MRYSKFISLFALKMMSVCTPDLLWVTPVWSEKNVFADNINRMFDLKSLTQKNGS